MIKKIKTDNINVDILLNTINSLKTENKKLGRENYYLKQEINNIRTVTLPIIIRRFEAMEKDNLSGKDLEKIFGSCGYCPEKIGVELLRKAGYYVFVPIYSNDEPTVKTQEINGKILY